jgi:hypothetical protein
VTAARHVTEPLALDTAAEIVELANELIGLSWAHVMARAAELNLSVAEFKALQHLDPAQPMPRRGPSAVEQWHCHTGPVDSPNVVRVLQTNKY